MQAKFQKDKNKPYQSQQEVSRPGTGQSKYQIMLEKYNQKKEKLQPVSSHNTNSSYTINKSHNLINKTASANNEDYDNVKNEGH